MPASEDRLATVDWDEIREILDSQGWAVLPGLLGDAECDAIAGLYGPGELFRSHVVMARHGFGQGEYRYFAYPLPSLVEQLRTALYPRLAPIANGWHERMQRGTRFPADHADFLSRLPCCRVSSRPTPLLLRYGRGDYNSLHQDLYGEHVFPLQAGGASAHGPGEDFSGWRIRADRAAAKDAIPRLWWCRFERRRGACSRSTSRPASGNARRLSRSSCATGSVLYDQGAPHAGNHLPRRPLILARTASHDAYALVEWAAHPKTGFVGVAVGNGLGELAVPVDTVPALVGSLAGTPGLPGWRDLHQRDGS